jgi:nucleotide-binding universal stress UspA family protein
MFHRILVPVDFSPNSLEALHCATDMARRYGASLTLLHANELLAVATIEDTAPAGAMQNWLADAEQLLEDMKAET